ncbi:hypothetical protein [Streptomyces sp. NPDC059003]|uniref:hypothetical protein n=1 Tax=Streptomyces sp. NPDC059003 TaxID=3346691 RepID=UPI0036C49585
MNNTPRPHPPVDVDFHDIFERTNRTLTRASSIEGDSLDTAVDQLLTDLSFLMNEVIAHTPGDGLRQQITGAHDVIAQARKIGVNQDFDEIAYIERLSWWTRYMACHLKLVMDDEAFR